ncbi:MAG: acetyl-CoA carboxylase biotin carboxyl carrier protein subunit [Gemmatimonadaceae bacterium]|nr:acetyl-CoA carboxylase biotin carboxyl carrier protein subunit [Gemmatimonadaceae bacterium]
MLDGAPVDASLTDIPGSPIRQVRIGDTVHRVVARRGARGQYTLLMNGQRHHVEALDARARAIRDLAAATAGPAGPSPLLAPMPGMIVRVSVVPGDVVVAGQGLIVMEAMKMENELRAAGPGTVTAVRAVVGSAVQKGAVLVELS